MGGAKYLSPEMHSKAVEHWQHIRFVLLEGEKVSKGAGSCLQQAYLGHASSLQEWRWLPSSQTRLEPSQWWKERSSLSSTPWVLRLEVSP